MSATDPDLRIRVPIELKDWLRFAAKASRRSVNGEIVYRLETAMRAEKAEPPAAGEAQGA